MDNNVSPRWRFRLFVALCATLWLFAPAGVGAQDHHAASTDSWTSGRPDGHAPIGVMGDHTHGAGEWMLSYRFMFMNMDGNRSGTDSQNARDVFDLGYMVAPKSMTMSMHMLGVMHAPTEWLTLMAMVPLVQLSMDHVTGMGAKFTTETEGIGDVKLAGLYRLSKWNRQAMHLSAGISLPTGAVDERGDTPAATDVRLPYPMQLGSGTVDLMPGLTYLGQSDQWSWGAQASGTFRVGENSEEYTLGNRASVTAWGARRWSDWVSSSLRMDGHTWGNIDGADDELNPAMVPTADPDLRAGERVDVLLGINFYIRSGFLKGHRLAFELSMPAYQSLDGPQLGTDMLAVVGWQYAF